MKRYLPLLAVLAVVAILLVLLFQGFTQQLIGDALSAVYRAILLATGIIPQPVYWALFIWFILISALGSLLGEQRLQRRARARPPSGRVAVWKNWMEQSSQRSAYQPFHRWRMAHNLAELAVEIVAHRERIALDEARRRLVEGEIEMPAAVADYFRAGLDSMPAGRFAGLTRLFRLAQAPAPLDLDPVRAIGFLETQLEVTDDNRNR